MSVKSCEKVEKSQVAMVIEVGPEEFEAALEKAYRKLRRSIRVPGFRPGKAPRKLIEREYGVEVFFDEAINAAFPDAYEAAVKEKELRVVGYPSVEMVGECTRDGFTFKATAPVYPQVTLGQYKGLSAPRAEVKVSDADVDARIGQLSERNTRLVSVEREAREGDTVVIDFEGFLDGVPFDGGKGENHSLELGSHSFVPGFEEQLAGMKAGEEKDLEIAFPENYTPELAGRDAVFKVKVHEVKEKDVPELDDEFAKDVSEFDTLQELRDDVAKKIAEEREKETQRVFEDALMDQVADGITAEIPDVMVEAQARQFLENLKRQVAQQGISYEQYLQLTGSDEGKLLQDTREPALRQVRMDLAVAAIIDEEHLEANDEEVEAEYAKLAADVGMDLEMVKRYFTVDQMKDQIATQKAIAIVADSATPTDPEETSAEEASAEASAETAEEAPVEAASEAAEEASEKEETPAKAVKAKVRRTTKPKKNAE